MSIVVVGVVIVVIVILSTIIVLETVCSMQGRLRCAVTIAVTTLVSVGSLSMHVVHGNAAAGSGQDEVEVGHTTRTKEE